MPAVVNTAGYDERAVALIERVRGLISTRPDPARMELGGLLNALEIHVETGDGHPDIVTSFERLFCDIAALRQLDGKTIEGAKNLFNDLRQHLHRGTAGR